MPVGLEVLLEGPLREACPFCGNRNNRSRKVLPQEVPKPHCGLPREVVRAEDPDDPRARGGIGREARENLLVELRTARVPEHIPGLCM